jgi:hypothetical protein
MSSPVRIAVLALIVGIVILQFFQPEKNIGSDDQDQDPLTAFSMPDSVSVILKRACLDCHSNHTDYPWYSRISPVSWYLNKHIVEGKDALNFSNFENLGKIQKIGALGDICDMVESGSMPLKSYLLIHWNARIGSSDVEAICSWSESEVSRILMLKK